MSEIKPWKVLQSEYVIENEKFRVRKDICQVPDGTIVQDYFVHEQPDAVIICCITKEDQVVLVRQYRHGMAGITLEFPGGSVTRHDINAAEAVRRELMEESGYSIEHVERIGDFALTPSSSTSRIAMYIGTGGERITAPQYVSDEHTEVVLVPVDALPGLVENPEFVSVVHIAVLATVLSARQRAKA